MAGGRGRMAVQTLELHKATWKRSVMVRLRVRIRLSNAQSTLHAQRYEAWLSFGSPSAARLSLARRITSPHGDSRLCVPTSQQVCHYRCNQSNYKRSRWLRSAIEHGGQHLGLNNIGRRLSRHFTLHFLRFFALKLTKHQGCALFLDAALMLY
jgi:hypothetical protein